LKCRRGASIKGPRAIPDLNQGYGGNSIIKGSTDQRNFLDSGGGAAFELKGKKGGKIKGRSYFSKVSLILQLRGGGFCENR
jgi:hypothetical protein